MKRDIDLLLESAAQVVTVDPARMRSGGEDEEARAVGAISGGAVAIDRGRILDVGRTDRLRDLYRAGRTIDASGRVVTPGLIDPHTHLVFGGQRHLEFGLRMKGADYQEILASGGGIHSTVAATRKTPVDELVDGAAKRLEKMLEFGVTTVEVKSGYGLDVETELKILETVRCLAERCPQRLVPTYLGAHVIPKEFADRRQAYVDLMIGEMIPKIAREQLAVACDVFLDNGAYTRDETEAILTAAVAAGLRPKVHAGQFSDQGGPELIAGLNGLSADHLEQISEAGIEAMAQAGVVANLLPGAAYSLRDHFPDGRRLIDRGVDVAVATDDNPGSSRTENLPLMASMAVTRMGLTCAEGMKAVTTNAAKALDLAGEIGAIIPGMAADLAVFDIPDFRALFYHFGMNHTAMVIAKGTIAIEEERR